MPRSAPQIEVSFDVDANGILNVSAMEKSTGKSEKITITNDKGRMSKEDIERLVEEAEKYKEEDEKLKEKIEAKNSFENYLFQLKNTLNDEKTKDKFEEADRETLTGKIDEATTWFDEHQDEDKEAYEAKQKEIEEVANPIMMKMYQNAGGGEGGMRRVECPLIWAEWLRVECLMEYLIWVTIPDRRLKKSIKKVD